MNALHRLSQNLDLVEERLGYIFTHKDLLVMAFTHRSFVNEQKDPTPHNERLEFLGDSVLGLTIADYLYRRLPEHSEGSLSQLRSKLVDAASCAARFRALQLEEFLLLGRGEQITEGKHKTSICADAFEAIVGAIYLDAGLPITKSFLLCHFEAAIEAAIDSPPRNYKAELQDHTQKKHQTVPVYKVVQETGPDHAKVFHVVVSVDGQDLGLGIGNSKKEAEQRAAFEALSKI